MLAAFGYEADRGTWTWKDGGVAATARVQLVSVKLRMTDRVTTNTLAESVIIIAVADRDDR